MHDLLNSARQAAEKKAPEKECIVVCDNSTDDWPIDEAANHLLGRLERLHNANPSRRVAVIADGEVSSPVIGDGVGGRNSAFVLNCVEKIAGKEVRGTQRRNRRQGWIQPGGRRSSRWRHAGASARRKSRSARF